MRKISLLPLLVAIIFTAKAQDLEKDKKEIRRVNYMLNRAIEKHDSLTLEGILAPDYALFAV
jgi:hypothetical protein